MTQRLFFFSIVLPAIFLTGNPVGISHAQSDSAEPVPARLQKPYTISYHSHWFLLGGLRVARRIVDSQTDVNILVGQSVVTGCGIQAPKCEQGFAMNAGLRRYLFDSPFTIYAGANIHYIHEGIRGTDGPTGLLDMSLGINHQTSGRFNWGIGYSFFALNDSNDGFEPAIRGWILSELGYSF
ncbi:MAG: hypothetical protein VYA30_16340 [Myxococcota bacterium]|nr:hypothetical protein [Myxococcota bacterium]